MGYGLFVLREERGSGPSGAEIRHSRGVVKRKSPFLLAVYV